MKNNKIIKINPTPKTTEPVANESSKTNTVHLTLDPKQQPTSYFSKITKQTADSLGVQTALEYLSQPLRTASYENKILPKLETTAHMRVDRTPNYAMEVSKNIYRVLFAKISDQVQGPLNSLASYWSQKQQPKPPEYEVIQSVLVIGESFV